MGLFDKKEDVIDIQLTQYGKHLLSKGKFKPAYYAFFDDDIIYDGKYAGITEEQNDVQDRIESTPKSRTQYVFTSRDKAVKELTKDIAEGIEEIGSKKSQPTAEEHYALSSSLGTSSLSSNQAPAWRINFLKGSYESRSFDTDEIHTAKVPQLEADTVVYKTVVNLGDSSPGFNGLSFEDGTIAVEEDYLLLDVAELNADFDNDNFDIEVFLVEEVEEENVKKEILNPLSFVEKPTTIKNDILLDEPEGGTAAPLPTVDDTYVEYWLTIKCDHEIDKSILCKNRPSSSTKGGLFTQDLLDCSEFEAEQDADRMSGSRTTMQIEDEC